MLYSVLQLLKNNTGTEFARPVVTPMYSFKLHQNNNASQQKQYLKQICDGT